MYTFKTTALFIRSFGYSPATIVKDARRLGRSLRALVFLQANRGHSSGVLTQSNFCAKCTEVKDDIKHEQERTKTKATHPAGIQEFLLHAEKRTHSAPNHHQDTPEQ